MTTLAQRIELAMEGPPALKQIDLANACGVTSASVSDWMSGKTKKMEGSNLLSAAAFLNVDPWWLATGEGSRDRGPNSRDPHMPPQGGAKSAAARAAVDAIVTAEKRGVGPKVFAAVVVLMQSLEE